MSQANLVPPMPATPPMTPGPLGSPRASAWPTVLGTLAIILAGFGILGGLWGFVASFFVGWFVTAPGTDADTMLRWRWWTLTSSAATLLLAILLLTGAIALTRRRAHGPRLLRIWSILRILFALISVVFTWQMMQEQVAGISSQGNAAGMSMLTPMLIFGVVLSLLWGLALPAFLLIFLGLQSSRRVTREWP